VAAPSAQRCNEGNNVSLSLANGAFVEKSFTLKKEFVDLLKKTYQTEVKQVPQLL
jgi:serine protease inhibitor